MGSLLKDARWIQLTAADKTSPLSPLTPFNQRQANNRSPLESPPVAKKLPKVQDTNHFFGKMFVGPQTMALLEIGQGKENRSILKKTYIAEPRDVQRGRLGSGKSERRVDFQQSVVVFHFDKVEGDHVCSESQRLSVEPKDRRAFLNRNAMNQSKNKNGGGGFSLSRILLGDSSEPAIQIASKNIYVHHSEHHEPISVAAEKKSNYIELPVADRRPLPALSSSSVEESTTLDDIDFVFFEDESRRLWLRFAVLLGSGVSASDVLVKANMTGNKVRIVGSRILGSGQNGSAIRQDFNERCMLPMEVDPYMITARMDGEGRLFVEGLILTPERKRSLAVQRKAKNGSTSS